MPRRKLESYLKPRVGKYQPGQVKNTGDVIKRPRPRAYGGPVRTAPRAGRGSRKKYF